MLDKIKELKGLMKSCKVFEIPGSLKTKLYQSLSELEGLEEFVSIRLQFIEDGKAPEGLELEVREWRKDYAGVYREVAQATKEFKLLLGDAKICVLKAAVVALAMQGKVEL